MIDNLETSEELAHKMKLLKNYPNFKLLQDILIRNEVEPLADRLRTYKGYKTIEERNVDVEKLENLEKIINAPEFYAESMMPGDKSPPPLDPYAQDIDQAREVADPSQQET